MLTAEDIGIRISDLAARIERLEHALLRREQVHGMLSEADTWPETYCMGTQRLYERDRKQGPQEEQ